MAFIAGTFSATGQSATFAPLVGSRNTNSGQFNVSVSGTFVATFQLQRSFDNAVTWIVCSSDSAGTAASWTAPFSVVVEEPEAGVLYRLACTAYTSGTATYRLSQ